MEYEFQHPYQHLDFTLAQMEVFKDPRPCPEMIPRNYQAAVALRMPIVEEVLAKAPQDGPLAGLSPQYVVRKVLKLESVIRRQQHWKTYKATTERPTAMETMPQFNHAKYPWAQELMVYIRNEIDHGAKRLEDVKILQREVLIMDANAKLFLNNPANAKWREKYTDEEFLLRVWAWDLHSKGALCQRTIRSKDGSVETHELPLALTFDMDEEMCQEFANHKATRMAHYVENPVRTYMSCETQEVLDSYTSDVANWYRRRQEAFKMPMIFDPKELGEAITKRLEWEALCELTSLTRRSLKKRESSMPNPPIPKINAEMVYLAQEFRNHRITIGLPPYPHWEQQMRLAQMWQEEVPPEHAGLPALIETFTNAWVEETETPTPSQKPKFYVPTQLFAKKKAKGEEPEASSSSSLSPPSPKKKFSLARINKLKQTGLRETNTGQCRKALYELILDFMHSLAVKRKGPTFFDSIYELPEEKLVDMVAIYVLSNTVTEHWKFAQRMSELYCDSPAPHPLMPHLYLFASNFFDYLANRYVAHGFNAPCIDIIAYYRLYDFYWTHDELVHQVATWLMKKPTETALSYELIDIVGMVKMNYHDVLLNTYRRYTNCLAPPGATAPEYMALSRRSSYVDPYVLQTWREYIATDPSFSDDVYYTFNVLGKKESFLTAKAGEFLSNPDSLIRSPWRKVIPARDLARMTLEADNFKREAAKSSCSLESGYPPIAAHLPLDLIHDFRHWLQSQKFATNVALELKHSLDHYVNYPLTPGLLNEYYMEHLPGEQVDPVLTWEHIKHPSSDSDT
ncbi:hypothetical protein M569_09264, partial [Genlisea aurea]